MNKAIQRTTLEFKICLHCGHVQNLGSIFCDNCHAGAIGLGKPHELWAYLDLKIESKLSFPEREKLGLVLNPRLQEPET